MRGSERDVMQEPDNRTDLEKYIDKLEKTIKPDQMIWRMALTNVAAVGYPEIHLEPEGNVENLDAGVTVELVLVLSRANPELRMKGFEHGLWIAPDWHGAIFQNGGVHNELLEITQPS
jgi:hypothetical protein